MLHSHFISLKYIRMRIEIISNIKITYAFLTFGEL